MSIAVINHQTQWKVNEPAMRKLTEFFLLKAGKCRGIQWGEVSLVLVDDAGSRAINKAHLGHDYPTDVISFNFDPIPGDPVTGACGEIVVNLSQAHRLGRRYGGTAHELALYIAHGCDHLAGEDDKTPAQRQRMRRRELRWIREEGGKGSGVRVQEEGVRLKERAKPPS
jgi:probable rRNA maturation factor